MSQYELVVSMEYKYLVDANNQHEAVSIYINDNDSCIPMNDGKMVIVANKLENTNES